MSTPRGWPGKQNFPAINGRFMVDTYRGKMRVRAWPKPRGKPKSRAQQIAIDRFTAANRLAKEAPGEIQNQCIEATKGSGLYPRDLLVRAILSGWYDIRTDDGRLIRHGRPQLETTLFQGFLMRLEENQFLSANTSIPISWPLPIRDTAGFWNPGAPSEITIPEGVTMMRFNIGASNATGGFQILRGSVRRIGPPQVRLNLTTINSSAAFAIGTGPVMVQPGETYVFLCNGSSSVTVRPFETFFSGEVVEAQV